MLIITQNMKYQITVQVIVVNPANMAVCLHDIYRAADDDNELLSLVISTSTNILQHST